LPGEPFEKYLKSDTIICYVESGKVKRA
jgi:hypothetical protein